MGYNLKKNFTINKQKNKRNKKAAWNKKKNKSYKIKS